MATTTWTQTAGMVSDEDTDNVESFAEQAEASKDAAAASETAAASSAASAASSATSAGADAATATTGAATATTKAAEASTSASNAATSATNASTSEANASSSAASAASSAAAAATSETNAATSATSAAASAASIGTEAADAAASATAAAASETAAAASETAAAASETAASTSETNAATSATTASTAATNAATSETNAATSATSAATSETNAATSETNAATSASSASTSASNAATSASAASASQVAAAASAASAANSYDLFDDRYLGTKTSDPTVDNDGNALVAGALYFNSTANEMRVYDGANWIAASSAGGASLLEYKYTATSGQTTFSGADDNANSLSYTQNNLIVTLNGVVLENGTDYTATTGTSVVLASGAATSDELNVIAFKTFTTADMVAASTGGTFYGDVDVQGTLTSDGLTVDGGSVNNDSNAIAAKINANGNEHIRLEISTDSTIGNQAALDLISNSNTSRIYTTGTSGLKFSTDGGSTSHLTIDGSGNVGIGTSSPSSFNGGANNLVVGSGSGSEGITIYADNASNSAVFFADTDSTTTGQLNYQHASNAMTFHTNGGTERMRIDSSGNLLVGKTASTGAVAGCELREYGMGLFTRSSANPLQVRRLTNDGSLIEFYKDAAAVGSIGVAPSNRLYIGNSDAGLRFLGDSNLITPWNPSTNSNSDNLLDLGNSANRWKDVYVGGGVYLGGTGSANKLDDYETGTWTPQLDANTVTWSYTHQAGNYVKIGDMVHAQFYILASVASGTSSFGASLINLPFTSANVSGFNNYAVPIWFSGSPDIRPLVRNNATTCVLQIYNSVSGATAADLSGHYFVGTASYRAA